MPRAAVVTVLWGIGGGKGSVPDEGWVFKGSMKGCTRTAHFLHFFKRVKSEGYASPPQALHFLGRVS